MTLPDKHTIAERFWKNKDTYKLQASVQKVLCECFASTLFSYKFPLQHILEIGCGTGFLTKEMLQNHTPASYIANDISLHMQQEISAIASDFGFQDIQFIAGDAETIAYPEGIDTIISTSTIQWFHDLNAFFIKAHDSLQDSGILAFSTFGEENFIEIKETLNKGLDYVSKKQIVQYLEPMFEICACYEWTETLWFNSPKDVLTHIKQTGVSGFGGTYFGKQKLQTFIESYQAAYSKNNKVCLTYNPIMFIAKKK